MKRSRREAARSLGISAGAVASVLSRATALGLTLEAVDGLTDDALEQRLYGAKQAGSEARPLPDVAWIHTELRRTGVTLELLHLEYQQHHPAGYRYSAFCRHYRRWLGRQRLSMRQVHKRATSCLSTTPARRRRSWIRPPAWCDPSSSSSRCWGRPTTWRTSCL